MGKGTRLALFGILCIALGFLLGRLRSRDPGAERAVAAATPAHPVPAEAPRAELSEPSPPVERAAAPASAPVSLPASPSAVAAAASTIVHGSLLDTAGTVIRGREHAGVSFYDSTGRRSTADAGDGTYAISGLSPDSYVISARAEGYRGADETLDLLPGQAMVRKDLTLSPAVTLKIRVHTPDGRNLRDVQMERKASMGERVLVPVATREPPGSRFDEIGGALNNPFGVGHFWNNGPRFDELPSGYFGILVLDVDPPVYASLVHYHSVLETKRVEPGQDEVTFVVSPEDLAAHVATIRVKVVDADTQRPIEGARLLLMGGTYFGADGPSTDASGIATIEKREPGRFDARISAKGYEGFRRSIVADPGVVTDLGVVALEGEIGVEARVVDGQGSPVSAEFNLGVVDPVTREIDLERQTAYRADGSGVLKLAGLGRRLYVLRTRNHEGGSDREGAATTWVSGNVLLDTRGGPVVGLVIRLQPAALLVLRVTGEPAYGLRFRVTDPEGWVLVSSRFYGSAPRRLKLPSGTYRVALLDSQGKDLTEREVTLGTEMVKVDLSR